MKKKRASRKGRPFFLLGDVDGYRTFLMSPDGLDLFNITNNLMPT